MAMLSNFKSFAKSTLDYLGDAAHRRFVATVAAMALTHLMGYALDANTAAAAIDLVVGGLAGAWSRTTPRLDEAQPSETL